MTEPIDFGWQPICSRFLSTGDEKEFTHRLAIGQCQTCGLIQIQDPVPAGELKPRLDWIVYNEPESHLDDLAARISCLAGITSESTVSGLSSVDDSLLKRLAGLGFRKQWRLEPQRDLGVAVFEPGVETIQSRLSPDVAGRIVDRLGKPDVVVARYILEHAQDIRPFLAALHALVNPHGYVVVEVPDCESGLENGDYSLIWEEHIFYYTATTFRHGFALAGFSVVQFESYRYGLQNALVIIATPRQDMSPPALSPDDLENENRRWRAAVLGFPDRRSTVQGALNEHRRLGRTIVLYGAAQHGCSFVNLLQLKDCIDFVVDDNVRKQGLFMPGSHLPIRQPSALSEEGAGLCLMATRPESQDNVRRAHQGFLDQGGGFLSIYPDRQER